MSRDTSRPLTERQRDVLQRIDRRVPIKVIARELNVSETRINQHIRALKDLYKVESLNELVEAYRAENRRKAEQKDLEKAYEEQPVTPNLKGEEDTPYRKNQIPESAGTNDTSERNDPGQLVMSDVLPLEEQAPWLRPGEPRVVPRMLDGEHAVLFRLLAIVGIAFGVLAAVVLAVTAAITISEALDGRADVPVDQQGFS